MPADGVEPVPEWGRILLGGIGCFLLAWISLGLAAKVGGSPLWLADALLIFLVLDRSGNALAGHLVAGAAGIVTAYFLLTGAFVAPAALLAVGSILHVALARLLLLRFAPDAARLESAGALAHLLLWSALLTPIAGALVMTGVALTNDGLFSVARHICFLVGRERRRHRHSAAFHCVAGVFGASRSQAAAEPPVGSPARPGAGGAAGSDLAPADRRASAAAWPAGGVVVGAAAGFQDHVAAVRHARAAADGRLCAGLCGRFYDVATQPRDAGAGTAGLSARHHPARLVRQPVHPGAARRRSRPPGGLAGAARRDGCRAGGDRHPDAQRQGRAVEPRRRAHLRLAARRG